MWNRYIKKVKWKEKKRVQKNENRLEGKRKHRDGKARNHLYNSWYHPKWLVIHVSLLPDPSRFQQSLYHSSTASQCWPTDRLAPGNCQTSRLSGGKVDSKSRSSSGQFQPPQTFYLVSSRRPTMGHQKLSLKLMLPETILFPSNFSFYCHLLYSIFRFYLLSFLFFLCLFYVVKNIFINTVVIKLKYNKFFFPKSKINIVIICSKFLNIFKIILLYYIYIYVYIVYIRKIIVCQLQFYFIEIHVI